MWGVSSHYASSLTHGRTRVLPSKFADTAVPALAKQVCEITGKDAFLYAKIAGRANMFANFSGNILDIGGKNVRAVKLALRSIRLTGEDVGGVHGRKIHLMLLLE